VTARQAELAAIETKLADRSRHP